MPTISIIADKLSGDVTESYTVDAGVNLHDWLISVSEGYAKNHDAVDKRRVITVEYADGDVIMERPTDIAVNDDLSIIIEPKEPITIVLAVVAIATAVYTYSVLQSLDNTQASTVPDGSSIYRLNNQGNQAKMGGVVPIIAGRHKYPPDYICSPWSEFVDHKEIKHYAFCRGLGEYEIHKRTIGNTSFDKYADAVSVSDFDPGVDVTEHRAHKHMYTSSEIGGSSGAAGIQIAGVLGRLGNNWQFKFFDGNKIRSYKLNSKGFHRKKFPFDAGATIQISGAGTNDGTFLIADRDGSEITISNPVTADPVYSPPASGQPALLSPAWGTDISGERRQRFALDASLQAVTHWQLEVFVYADGYLLFDSGVVGVTQNVHYVTTPRYYAIKARLHYKIGGVWTYHDFLFPDRSSATGFTDADNVSCTIDNLGADGDAGGWTQAYVAAPENISVEKCYLDFMLRGGLTKFEDDGDSEEHTVKIHIQVRDISEGAWRPGKTIVWTDNTVDDLAFTIPIILGSSTEPEFRVRRVSVESDDTQIRESVEWVGLRSELPAASRYPFSTSFVSIEVTNTLADAAKNRLYWEQTLKTQVLDNGVWTSSKYPNRDIAPLVRHLNQLAGYEDSRIDLPALLEAHEYWTDRGIQFDGVIDKDGTFKDLVARILGVGEAAYTDSSGKFAPVIDRPRTDYDQMYSPSVIRKGGIKKETRLVNKDEPNGYIVEYMDTTTWKTETVRCLLPHHDPDLPSKDLSCWGLTDRTNAWRWGMRRLAEAYERRTSFSFGTELDGWTSDYGSYVTLPATDNTLFGVVLADSGSTLTLDQNVPPGIGWKICVRKQNGTMSVLCDATVLTDRHEVQLSDSLGFTPDYTRGEKPIYMLGQEFDFVEPVLVTEVNPSTRGTTVKATNYSDAVYQYDDQEPASDDSPTIAINGDNPTYVEYSASYSDAGATASDADNPSVPVTSRGTVATSTPGYYEIDYSAANAHGVTTRSRVVVVRPPADSNAPTISIAGSNPVTVPLGHAYTDAGATAQDTIDGFVPVSSSNNVDTSTPGSYEWIYSASDSDGNSTTAIRTVIVVSDTAPLVSISSLTEV